MSAIKLEARVSRFSKVRRYRKFKTFCRQRKLQKFSSKGSYSLFIKETVRLVLLHDVECFGSKLPVVTVAEQLISRPKFQTVKPSVHKDFEVKSDFLFRKGTLRLVQFS